MSHDMTKPTKWVCTQQRLRSASASAQSDQSSLCAQWVAKDSRFLHADSEDSDQTGQMPRLIWVFAGCPLTLLVLSCCCSYVTKDSSNLTNKPHLFMLRATYPRFALFCYISLCKLGVLLHGGVPVMVLSYISMIFNLNQCKYFNLRTYHSNHVTALILL